MEIRFSKYDFNITSDAAQQFIFDIIRKKNVVLTPEEWVRQHIVHYLINDYGFPKSLISLEKLILVVVWI
ncbi:MAG: type I restriction enzyme HsdR N-terminal domain-containing protein [Bacteroidetes bacterium]|nr:type I restriction enzyme HsdR N-terminal domain-containing protein [Bacteroidota bacterium]